MDLNYFLHREQIERVRAEVATSDEARSIHLELAGLYRERIDSYRAGLGAPFEARPIQG